MNTKHNPNPAACEADANDIEYIVCHVGMLWRHLVNAKIKALGISGTEKRVLFCIARNPGWTQVKIANLLDLEPQNIIRTLDKLEQQHWLEKHSDPQDRRAKCLHVTAAGKEKIAQIKALTDSLKPNILTGIADKNVQTVIHHLAAMKENLIKLLAEDFMETKEDQVKL